MSLSSDLISQFVKATKDTTPKKSESTVYATVVYDGRPYVKLDGSDLLTPVSTTADVKDGERVTVLIKDHTATITGNLTSPAARTEDVRNNASKISEFEIVMAYKVTTEDLEAINATIESLRTKFASITELDVLIADIDKLQAKFADLQYVDADTLKALNAEIESLEAKFGEFTDLSTEDFEAINADILSLKGYTADFTYVSAEVLDAVKAGIRELDAKKLSAEQADIRYANIDFTNIGDAAIDTFYAKSGIINKVTISEGVVVKELVGVTIKGDLIEGGTVKADKLVVQGTDGLFYKLNFEGGTFTDGEVVPDDSLHGSVITAKSIVAEKISVDDLVAFDATIGGFNITDHSIYSGVKDSLDNTTRGMYLDASGQFIFGDGTNYFEFYEAEDGSYHLAISAERIAFSNGQTVNDVIRDEVAGIRLGGRNLIRNSTTLIFADYYFTESTDADAAITVEDDGNGNITIESSAFIVTDDGNGNVTLDAPNVTVTHDGNGNVVIT